MTSGKTDLLAECNNLKIPLEDFVGSFCSRCLQTECTRSQSGKTRFDARVSTWEQRLFTNVAKMDPADERFSKISAQRFLSLATSPPGEASAWVDPRNLESTKAFSIPLPEPSQVRVEPSPMVMAVPTEPQVVSPPIPATRLINTPTRSGQMIGGASVQPAVPVSDPWQSPKSTQASKPGEIIVKPGAKIKLGS